MEENLVRIGLLNATSMQEYFQSKALKYLKNAEVILERHWQESRVCSSKNARNNLRPDAVIIANDAKFPSGLYDTYLDSINQDDERSYLKIYRRYKKTCNKRCIRYSNYNIFKA